MADEQITVELLMAYGFDKQHAEAAFRSIEEYSNKHLRSVMSKEEREDAKLWKAKAEKARLAYEYRQKLAEKTAQEIAKKEEAIEKEAREARKKANREEFAIKTAQAKKLAEEKARYENSPAVIKAAINAQRVQANSQAASQRLVSANAIANDPVPFGQAVLDETYRLEKEKEQAAKNYQETVKGEIALEGTLTEEYEKQLILLRGKDDARKLSESRIGAEGSLRTEYVVGEEAKKKEVENKKRQEKEYYSYVEALSNAAKERDKKKQSEIYANRKKQEREFQEKQERDRETAYRKEVNRLQKQKELLNSIAQGARAVALVSTGMLTGMIALATKWANKMEQEGTRSDISRQWVNAMKNMEKSSMRIGSILADRLVPYLEKAADFVSKVADWVEQNPELVDAGIKGIAAIATISTVVGTLLKIVTMLQAMNLKGLAAGMGGSGAFGTGATAAITPLLGTILPIIVTAIVAYLAVKSVIASRWGEKAGNWAQRKLGMEETTQEAGITAGKQLLAISAAGWATVFEKLGIASEGATAKVFETAKELLGLETAADAAAKAIEKTEAELKEIEATTKQFEAIMDNLAIADMEAEKQYKENVAQIIQSSNSRLLEIERQGRQALNNLAVQNKKAEKAERDSLVKDLSKMDADYGQQRADIIRSTNEDIVRIQAQTQDELRKLEEEHLLRVEDFTRSRDALGLAKENRDYDRRRGEVSEEGQKAIAERKRESAIQLAELKRSHAQQRVERIQAAAQQAAERKKAYAEQVVEIQRRMAEERAATLLQKQHMLADLAKQYSEERRKRYEAAAQQLKDINMALVSERSLKNKYYAAMLKDVNVFGAAFQRSLQNYLRTKSSMSGHLGSGTIQGSRAAGGYSFVEGLYRMAEGNKKEFVMSNQTTSAAEKLVGGHLTQAKLLAALQSGGGKASLVLNDNRRFDGNVPKNVRDQIREETLADVGKMLAMIGSRR